MAITDSLDAAAAAVTTLATQIAGERTAVLASVPAEALATDILAAIADNLYVSPAHLAAALSGSGFSGSALAAALTAALSAQGYAFDLAAPPSSPILLAPFQKARITFESVASVPLHIQSQPGIYRVVVATTATSTTNADPTWQPNDATYSGAFSNFSIQAYDAELTSFGSATAAAGFTAKTASPFLGKLPIVEAATASLFQFDQFGGPSGSDTINDVGPQLAEYLVSTYTAAKMIKMSSGVMGGPAINFCKWNDTTTLWTSLGTIGDASGTSLTGAAVVERLA